MSTRYKKYLPLAIITIVFAFLALLCDARLQVTYYTIDTDKIQQSIRFAVITDLHSSSYGKDMNTLIHAVQQEQPDCVLLVGDIFDANHDNQNSWDCVIALAKEYPCYYVTGNHEMRMTDVDDIKHQLTQIGVHVLSGDSKSVNIHDQQIMIHGVDDYFDEDAFNAQIQEITTKAMPSQYNILLSHRPELVDKYEQCNVDIVIAGHAHGGQARIPLIAPNGLYAPHQGTNPKYTNGIHQFNNWSLLVSRGLDKRSTKYPRILNRPELIILDIT